MLTRQPAAPATNSISASWTYSPDPVLEQAVQDIRQRYPATYPAGLERVHAFLDKLGRPHRSLPFTFHVAGTNGKGSTLAFLQAACEAGGLSVHKFISPHLIRFEERITLNGKMIEPQLLLALIKECDHAANAQPVSFFEFFTAVSFLAYARFPADVLLLETGLGGLYDATNVIAGPDLVSILTPISYDHTHILGTTLPEIAANKAGIIKPSCPVVIAPQTSSDVMAVFTAQAEKSASPVYSHGRDWHADADETGFDYRSKTRHFRLPLPRLHGRHQVDNACTALAALEESPFTSVLEQKKLASAMTAVDWPGRLQKITGGSLAVLLPPQWELWLDGAHNEAGADIVSDQLKKWGTDKPLHLVTAMKRTKDAAEFYRRLLPHVKTVQAVDVSWIEAPMTSAEALCDQIRKLDYPEAKTAANLESAIRALTFQFSTPQRILITGSLYLVGHALKKAF